MPTGYFLLAEKFVLDTSMKASHDIDKNNFMNYGFEHIPLCIATKTIRFIWLFVFVIRLH